MSADDVRERFACPVSWCYGYSWCHGGDGADPSSWLHESAAQHLPGGLTVTRWATALDGEHWALHTAGGAEIHEAASPGELADLLAQVLQQLRSLTDPPAEV